MNQLGADLLSIAGHKLYAPKGVGALFVRRGVDNLSTGFQFGTRVGVAVIVRTDLRKSRA